MSIAFAEHETATQDELFVPRASATRAGLFHCLIVAENAERRAFLAEAARDAGWEIMAYADVSAASAAAHRFQHGLSIVDLAGLEPGTASSFLALTESLSAASPPLLIVCGNDGNPLEEIWARQLGVWLYLAGVDSTCDVTSLCDEAKQIVQKSPAYARTA